MRDTHISGGTEAKLDLAIVLAVKAGVVHHGTVLEKGLALPEAAVAAAPEAHGRGSQLDANEEYGDAKHEGWEDAFKDLGRKDRDGGLQPHANQDGAQQFSPRLLNRVALAL